MKWLFQGVSLIALTSVEAQSRFGELIDRSQREPIEVTWRGRTVAYVVCEHDMKELVDLRKRREEASSLVCAIPAKADLISKLPQQL